MRGLDPRIHVALPQQSRRDATSLGSRVKISSARPASGARAPPAAPLRRSLFRRERRRRAFGQAAKRQNGKTNPTRENVTPPMHCTPLLGRPLWSPRWPDTHRRCPKRGRPWGAPGAPLPRTVSSSRTAHRACRQNSKTANGETNPTRENVTLPMHCTPSRGDLAGDDPCGRGWTLIDAAGHARQGRPTTGPIHRRAAQVGKTNPTSENVTLSMHCSLARAARLDSLWTRV
jgi:hypothetical protein